MSYKFAHFNFNVTNIEASKKFYKDALSLEESHRISNDDFTIVYLKDDSSSFLLELTELKSHPQKYDLGEEEFHLALTTKDYEGSLKKHQEMGCVEYINEDMGIYFILDPDGYWIEILPEK